MLHQKRIQNLNFVVADTYQEMSEFSAGLLHEQIKQKPNFLLCAATGNTPTDTYKELAKRYTDSPQDFTQLRVLKLDEWGGVPMDDPSTCEVYLQEHLLKPLNIDPANYIAWDSAPANPAQEVLRIEDILEQEAEIDVCILGLGMNGHLAFNEPGNFLHSRPHIAKLAKSTQVSPMANKSSATKEYGLTLGMNHILGSKKILFLVNGEHKRDIFQKFLEQKITTSVPATMLWMHPNVTVICDKESYPNL